MVLFFWAALLAIPRYAGAEDAPILIASIFAHSGRAAEENTPNYQMARLAAEVINGEGGVLGRSIKLLEFDNRSTALGAYQAAQDAVKAGAVAVVGPSWSSHAMAMAPVFQKAGIPMVGATTTAPEVTQVGSFIFRACYTDGLQAAALAKFAYEDIGARRAAMLVVAGDVFSEGIASMFRKRFEAMGGKVVSSHQYLLSSMEYGKQLHAVAADEPDLVFVPGFARDSGLILKEARSMGMEMPFLGADGWSALEQYPHIGSLAGRNYYSSHWHHGLDTAESRAFVRLIRQEIGDDALEKTDSGNPVAFDALMLLVEAIRSAGSDHPKAIRDALASISGYRGVTGTISYNGKRDPEKPVVLLQLSGKSVEYVKTVQPKP